MAGSIARPACFDYPESWTHRGNGYGVMPDENRLLLVLFEHRPIFFQTGIVASHGAHRFDTLDRAFTFSTRPPDDAL
jgi:hypothetical protein